MTVLDVTIARGGGLTPPWKRVQPPSANAVVALYTMARWCGRSPILRPTKADACSIAGAPRSFSLAPNGRVYIVGSQRVFRRRFPAR
jgi:hypothetical protein